MKISVTFINQKLAHARDGEVVLYKRGDSKSWQARYKLKGTASTLKKRSSATQKNLSHVFAFGNKLQKY